MKIKLLKYKQICPSEHAIKTKTDLQLLCWTDMQMCAISEVFYLPINLLKRAAGTVCSPVFLLDKNHSVKPTDSSSSLSRSVSAGKLDKTIPKQRCVAQRDGNSLEHCIMGGTRVMLCNMPSGVLRVLLHSHNWIACAQLPHSF